MFELLKRARFVSSLQCHDASTRQRQATMNNDEKLVQELAFGTHILLTFKFEAFSSLPKALWPFQSAYLYT